MKLWAITFNTFRENIRDRVLYNILAFAVIMLFISIALGRLSISEWHRVTLDFGLSFITLFGVMISVFLGIGLVSKEIERKTILSLIAKPVPRWQFILGRYFGLMITIFVNLGIMSLVLGLVLWINREEPGWPLTWPIIQAVIMTYIELSILTAVAMVFSTFSTSTLSSIFTLGFFVIGRLTPGLREFIQPEKNPAFSKLIEVLYYIVPNLTNYVRVEAAVYGEGLPPAVFLRIMAVGILTAAFFLLIAVTIFERRNFV